MSMDIETRKQIENKLWDELDGGLFVSVYINSFHWYKQRIFNLNKNYYTVKDKKVLEIHKSGLHPTGDDVWSFITECKKVGTYNPNKKYKNICKEITYSFINKLL